MVRKSCWKNLEAVIKRAKLFLLFLFTDSYTASKKQQYLQLFIGVASGKLHLLTIIQGAVPGNKTAMLFFTAASEFLIRNFSDHAVR